MYLRFAKMCPKNNLKATGKIVRARLLVSVDQRKKARKLLSPHAVFRSFFSIRFSQYLGSWNRLLEARVSSLRPFLYYPLPPRFFLQLMTVKDMVHVWKEMYRGGRGALLFAGQKK